ncbi:hypothetical protein B5X24_HaOG214650 [Helicoverpa armigera]|uniref:Uncharacterized protein n=1 Tax=Helicoverpa armigera TaxID=29058 RepID=A0A2W1BD74_HELAM|nr:hypothetical protein B5X24_HaOG214650 [Helicoverpa armigera]
MLNVTCAEHLRHSLRIVRSLRLRGLVNKLELMRTLLARLVTSRGRRDCLAEPARTARLLALTRTPCSLHSFLHQ